MSSTSSTKPHHRHQTSPSSLDPWEALFSSVTRPRIVSPAAAAPDNVTNARGGYTILIQHSMTPSSQRQWAVASSTMISGENKTYVNSISGSCSILPVATSAVATRRAAAPPPPPAHWNDSMSGPMVVQQVFEELCHRCTGAVVFVSLLGTTGGNNFVDLDELDPCTATYQTNDGEGDHIIRQSINNLQLSRIGSRRVLLRTFQKNGAWVDLSSNPFGWEEEDKTSHDHNSDTEDQDTSSCNNSLFVHRSTIHELHPIVRTIRKAVASIEHRRRHHQSTINTNTTLPQQQQPIPIVFDSLTPLLQFHGVEKTIVMLKCLRSGVPSSSFSTRSIVGGSSSSITPPLSTTTASILSPIVAPVLYESLRPSEHRNLEDISDAMIHLKLSLDISEYRPFTTTTTTTSPPSLTDQIPAEIDLVRRGGGGGGGGSGGKLIRHCIPVRIMRSSFLDSTNNINHPLKEDWHWEIFFHDKSHGNHVLAVAKEELLQTNPLENAGQQNLLTSATKSMSRPRIYLQEDDPDNDFYDEEADYDYG